MYNNLHIGIGFWTYCPSPIFLWWGKEGCFYPESQAPFLTLPLYPTNLIFFPTILISQPSFVFICLLMASIIYFWKQFFLLRHFFVPFGLCFNFVILPIILTFIPELFFAFLQHPLSNVARHKVESVLNSHMVLPARVLPGGGDGQHPAGQSGHLTVLKVNHSTSIYVTSAAAVISNTKSD